MVRKIIVVFVTQGLKHVNMVLSLGLINKLIIIISAIYG